MCKNIKKHIIIIVVILLIPLWLNLINYILDFVIQAGLKNKTYIGIIGSK